MFSKISRKIDGYAKKVSSAKVPLLPTLIIGTGAVVISGLLGQRAGMTIVRNYYNCLVLDERAIVAAAALAVGATTTAAVIINAKKNDEVVGTASADPDFYAENPA